MPFQLTDHLLHVWALRLEASAPQLERAAQWLAADELARARRYSAEPARREFMLTRAALRVLLGGYLGEPPQALRFAVAPRGKPALLSEADTPPVEFNVSHSGGVALLAFGCGCAIGVDVEACEPLPELAQGGASLLVERVFDAADAARWQALPEPARLAAFYRAWARKEACAKVGGDGLWADLTLFDRGSDAARELCVHDLLLGCGHAAALAHAGAPRPLAPLRWLDAATLLSGGAAFARAA